MIDSLQSADAARRLQDICESGDELAIVACETASVGFFFPRARLRFVDNPNFCLFGAPRCIFFSCVGVHLG